MKKIVVITSMFLFVLFSSCVGDSDWGQVVIASSQPFVFIETEQDVLSTATLVVPVNNEDTVFVKNRNLVNRACYLRMVYPEKDIVIDYVRIEEDEKKILDPRFVNIKK